MGTLLFLSRVAVIMNVMFLLFIAGRFGLLPIENSYLNGLIITIGWGISPILNVILHPILFVFVLLKRKDIGIPAWILIFNLFCFVFQIFFYFFT
jgi:hypothetical protein